MYKILLHNFQYLLGIYKMSVSKNCDTFKKYGELNEQHW